LRIVEERMEGGSEERINKNVRWNGRDRMKE